MHPFATHSQHGPSSVRVQAAATLLSKPPLWQHLAAAIDGGMLLAMHELIWLPTSASSANISLCCRSNQDTVVDHTRAWYNVEEGLKMEQLTNAKSEFNLIFQHNVHQTF